MLKQQGKMTRTREQQHSAAGAARLAAFLVVVLAASMAFGQSPKMSKDLQKRPASDTIDVIVQYADSPASGNFTKAKGAGATLRKQMGLVKAAVYTLPAGRVQNLLDSDSSITYVSPDRPLKSTAATTDFYDQAVNAPYGWGLGLDGTGIGVAVIDSGINLNLADLKNTGNKNRVVYSHNFDTSSTTTADLYGHGTHVAGVIAGNGAFSNCNNCFITFQGIAPNAKLINLRVLDQNGASSDSEVIDAIEAAIKLKSRYNIRVINLSLGRPVYESYTLDPLCQAVEQAWKAGILVVVAAGNEGRNDSANTGGYGTIIAPGNDPYVITVGAMKPMGTADRSDDLIASYSSKGPTLYDHVVKPDIVAPGNKVISLLASTSDALYTQFPSNTIQQSYFKVGPTGTSQQYFVLSGTSISTGVVSGAAALMLQQNPALTPDQVKARLMKTAYKVFPQYSAATDPTMGATYTSQYDIFTVGAGYLDIQTALNNTDLAPANAGSALSPSVAVDANGDVYIVTGTSVVWGSSVMWGTSVVWGTSVIWGTNVAGQSVLWGSSVCWGSSTTQGYSVIWGSSVVWGTSNTDSTESLIVAINGDN